MLELEILEDCTYFYEATRLVELILNLASFANFNNLQWKNMYGLAPSVENSWCWSPSSTMHHKTRRKTFNKVFTWLEFSGIMFNILHKTFNTYYISLVTIRWKGQGLVLYVPHHFEMQIILNNNTDVVLLEMIHIKKTYTVESRRGTRSCIEQTPSITA